MRTLNTDSFGVDWKVDWGWQRQLAGQLNVDKVVNPMLQWMCK
ncbi:MAG: hypothetical protein CM15mP106_4720 [Candidatus Neomarinimicrobiota bacterium]|nr:MAG: hypothetical protein CM15mP106_4720 [Candidatus Neomarinimicrobiota bacterium]